jgi:hypothetical protein
LTSAKIDENAHSLKLTKAGKTYQSEMKDIVPTLSETGTAWLELAASDCATSVAAETSELLNFILAEDQNLLNSKILNFSAS